MNRRGFFGLLAGAAVASTIPEPPPEPQFASPVPVKIGVAAWTFDAPPVSYQITYYRDGVLVTDSGEWSTGLSGASVGSRRGGRRE